MRVAAVAVLVFATIALAGCGAVKDGVDKSKAMNALKALSIDYFEYQTANQGRAPASATELTGFLKGRQQEPALIAGELEMLTVQWGAKLDPKGADAGKRVLASGPKAGGDVPVMMQDGSVKWLAEAAFASASKAEPAKQP